jgi:hypothetical protein
VGQFEIGGQQLRSRNFWQAVRQTAQKRKAVTCVTNFLNSGTVSCAKVGTFLGRIAPFWLTPVAFRFTRPAFHRGRSRCFTALHCEHMPTCKIAMHKCAISDYAFNRLCDLAFRSSIILFGRFAVGLVFLLQRGYSIANYLPSPVSTATM